MKNTLVKDKISFKSNPMTAYRDLLTNKDYGLGMVLTEAQESYITTWEKYCDEKVEDK